MPFIPEKERRDIADGKEPTTPGQLCYVEYKKLMEGWNKEPRWTTAHKLFQQVKHGTIDPMYDKEDAKELAWMVFFMWKVFFYELEKEEENGTIE